MLQKKVKVKFKFLSSIACEVGAKELDMTVSSDLEIALTELQHNTKLPALEYLESRKYSLLINGRAAKLLGVKVTLSDGDVLAFLPIMGGG